MWWKIAILIYALFILWFTYEIMRAPLVDEDENEIKKASD